MYFFLHEVDITFPAFFTFGFMKRAKMFLVFPRSTHPTKTPTPTPTASEEFMKNVFADANRMNGRNKVALVWLGGV